MKKICMALPILMVLCALSTGADAETLPIPQAVNLGFEGVNFEGTGTGTAEGTFLQGTTLVDGMVSFNENVIYGLYGGSRPTTSTTEGLSGWATPNQGPIDSISRVINGPLLGLDVAKYFQNKNDFDGNGVSLDAAFLTDKLPSLIPGQSFLMVVNFATPVVDLAFYALDIDAAIVNTSGGITTAAEGFWAKIYGENGFTQEMFVTGDYNDAAYWVAFNNTVGITKLEMQVFRDTNGNGIFNVDRGGVGIDYLSFTPVPEPATMFLLGSGLIGVGVFVRRKFKK
jgi:hypothetical protein